ncbi:MAG: sensor histidine kinase [Marmoricola sp.]
MHQPNIDDASVLTETVSALSAATTVDEITATVTAAVRRLTGADGATFVLREDGRCFYVDEDAIGPLWKGSRFPMTACVSGWAMLNSKTAVVPDIFEDPRVPIDAYKPTFVRSLAMAPIGTTTPVGALGAYWSEEHVPEQRVVRKLEVLANSAAVALENLELRGEVARRTSERDELESALHSVIHDLRSPLGAMMGYAELVMDASTDPEVRRFATAIWASGERVGDQIDQLLALYRITRGQPQPTRVDLAAIAHRVADELRAAERSHPVDVEIEDDLEVIADPALAEILVRNLVGNAFKYSGRSGVARIRVGRADHHKPYSTFYVSDNGVGFDAGDADLLFKPMVRLSTAQDFPGNGLGLASVARIVDLHGGSVRAESPDNGGATFYFSLEAV